MSAMAGGAPGAGGGAAWRAVEGGRAGGGARGGGGGAIGALTAPPKKGCPRARVGWRRTSLRRRRIAWVPPGAGGVAISSALRLSCAAGSPGRGWGGGRFALRYPLRFRFPRARVGWRLGTRAAAFHASVAPGAGGA